VKQQLDNFLNNEEVAERVVEAMYLISLTGSDFLECSI
jgi:hypothetical protein